MRELTAAEIELVSGGDYQWDSAPPSSQPFGALPDDYVWDGPKPDDWVWD